MKIILGSASPRRQSLLKELGYSFEVIIPDIEEVVEPNVPMEEVAVDLATKKARHLLPKIAKESVLICADTVVIFEQKILGKPANKEQAVEYLTMLSGNEHQVITGVAIMNLEKSIQFSETTLVRFKILSSDEIHHYVDHFQPFDKAGAYGIQDWIGLIGVERIQGSYTNVMGLPTQLLNEKLKSF